MVRQFKDLKTWQKALFGAVMVIGAVLILNDFIGTALENPTKGTPVQVAQSVDSQKEKPHLYQISKYVYEDRYEKSDWYYNGDKNLILVAKSGNTARYLDKSSVVLQPVPNENTVILDGMIMDTVNGVPVTYPDKKAEIASRHKHFIINGEDKTIKKQVVEGSKSYNNLPPFTSFAASSDPRVFEMMYYIMTGKKAFGDKDPAKFIELEQRMHISKGGTLKNFDDIDRSIVNWYTKDLYERCDGN